MIFRLYVCISLALCGWDYSDESTIIKPAAPKYIELDIRGWRVKVDSILIHEHRDLAGQVVDLLDAKLLELTRTLPAKPLEFMRTVTIWVDYQADRFPGCVYHPSEEWLKEHGFNPEMARSVHVANARNFLEWSLHQPSMILHEMAHAYHHQVLGHHHEGIRRAYEQALADKRYDSVLRYDGSYQRAYALNNDQEFFAEMTEAFFGVNDFYPFVKSELMHHDPAMYELLNQIWLNSNIEIGENS